MEGYVIVVRGRKGGVAKRACRVVICGFRVPKTETNLGQGPVEGGRGSQLIYFRLCAVLVAVWTEPDAVQTWRRDTSTGGGRLTRGSELFA